MSAGYVAVQWNRRKLVYDAIALAAIALYIGSFIAIRLAIDPPKDWAAVADLRLQAFGSCAFLLLTFILAIGPLTRLDRRFLPVLYNRRHLGVMTFVLVAIHFAYMFAWFDAINALPHVTDDVTAWGDYAKFIGFPFKTLGFAAFLVLFLLAATSHDFWLAFLTPGTWKTLHMALYVAYGLAAIHVALGAMQEERTLSLPLMLFGCVGVVAALHVVAAWREHRHDRGTAPGSDGWIAVGPLLSIPDQAALIVAAPGGERIAVFRDGRRVGALTNLCAHQQGPLGEGRIINGCVTCPWHGYEYRLDDGCAPPPYTEKVATYPVRITNGIVEVDPHPLPPGTPAAITVKD
jgi:DMSO/TMAO reductase YedYZ heme-binding membrane subunit/nitrite reductase/ring-hydroxylating ferredoxin subunit